MQNATAIHATTPVHLTPEDMAAASFLASYRGKTRRHYGWVLGTFYRWANSHGYGVLELKRPHVEMFVRHLDEERGLMPSTCAHYLTIIKMFYRTAVIDDYLIKSPAEHVRRPRFYRDETRLLGLDRSELGAVLHAANASSPVNGALIALLGLLGLRVSEACAVNIEDFDDVVRGHHVLRLVGKGNKAATIPLPPMVHRALIKAAGDRAEGPLLVRATTGTRMTPAAAARVVTRLCRVCGIDKHITPHSLRRSFVTAAFDAGVPLRDVQIAARHQDPRVTMMYDTARSNLDRHAVHTVTAFIAGAA